MGGAKQKGSHDQHKLLARKWKRVVAGEVPCPGDNHFTVLDRFSDGKSELFRATANMVVASA